jgi:hypothetical protein
LVHAKENHQPPAPRTRHGRAAPPSPIPYQDLLFMANCFPLMRNGVDFIKATRYWLGGRVEA